MAKPTHRDRIKIFMITYKKQKANKFYAKIMSRRRMNRVNTNIKIINPTYEKFILVAK